MRTIRDIDVFSGGRLVRSMTAWSLAILVAGVALSVTWVLAGWPHESIGPSWVLGLVLSAFAAFAAHEPVHAAFFKLFGGSRAHVEFGASRGLLYASAVGLVLPRAQFVVVLLAPTVLVSTACLAVGASADVPLAAFATLAVHLSGCAGDLAFVRAVLSDGRVTHVQDTDRGILLLSSGGGRGRAGRERRRRTSRGRLPRP